MTYGQYIEGYSNNVFLREYVQGYKTIQGLKKAVNKYVERNKIVILGYVKFSFNGNSFYNKDNYKIIDQYNAKAFFEYWN